MILICEIDAHTILELIIIIIHQHRLFALLIAQSEKRFHRPRSIENPDFSLDTRSYRLFRTRERERANKVERRIVSSRQEHHAGARGVAGRRRAGVSV